MMAQKKVGKDDAPKSEQRPRLRVRGELLCQKRDEGEHEATRDGTRVCFVHGARERGGGREEGKRRLQNLMFNS